MMKIYFGKKAILLDVKKVSFFGKLRGLMFKPNKTSSLLFEFNKKEICTIHSFFVFFPFLALWLDEKNNLLEWDLVKPFTFSLTPKNRPVKLVEVPINRKNAEIVKLFVGKKETFKYVGE